MVIKISFNNEKDKNTWGAILYKLTKQETAVPVKEDEEVMPEEESTNLASSFYPGMNESVGGDSLKDEPLFESDQNQPIPKGQTEPALQATPMPVPSSMRSNFASKFTGSVTKDDIQMIEKVLDDYEVRTNWTNIGTMKSGLVYTS